MEAFVRVVRGTMKMLVTFAALTSGVGCGGRLMSVAELPPAAGSADTDSGMFDAAPPPGGPGSGAAVDASSEDVVVEDAGSSEIDAAGVPEVADCLRGPNAISVVATGGYGGLSGSSAIFGEKGTWTSLGNGVETLQVNDPPGDWGFAADGDVIHRRWLAPGASFSSALGSSYAQVKVAGRGCDHIPTGTFTIVDVAGTPGDQGTLIRALAWFDLVCDGVGELKGCARFTR